MGEYRDLNDPQICSRYRLGIAPVFGENLIFETPLASLAMSTSVVPDSLPEIEELERYFLFLEKIEENHNIEPAAGD